MTAATAISQTMAIPSSILQPLLKWQPMARTSPSSAALLPPVALHAIHYSQAATRVDLAYNQPHLGLYVADELNGKSRRGFLGDVMAETDH